MHWPRTSSWSRCACDLHSDADWRSAHCSNFSVHKTKKLLGRCRHAPSVNQVTCRGFAAAHGALLGGCVTPALPQVENHPYWRNDQLSNYLSNMNIHLTAYSPLGTPGQLHDLPALSCHRACSNAPARSPAPAP